MNVLGLEIKERKLKREEVLLLTADINVLNKQIFKEQKRYISIFYFPFLSISLRNAISLSRSSIIFFCSSMVACIAISRPEHVPSAPMTF